MALVLVGVLTMGSLAACGSSSDSGSSSSGGEAAEETTASELLSANEMAKSEDLAEKDEDADYSEFVIGVQSISSSLSPWLIDSSYGDLIYTCLAKTDRETGETIGYMGDVTLSDDQLTVYVELWDNIYDTAGNHITADDVIFSWDTAKAEGVRSVSDYTGWAKTGDYSLEFYRKEKPTMEGATLTTYIISQAAYESSKDGMATDPVGCGIYYVDEFTSDYVLTLARNEDFWATDEQRAQVEAGYGKQWDANWDKLTWRCISESTQLTVALEMGDLDYTDSMPTDELEMVKTGELADEFSIYNYVSGLTYCFIFNTDPASPLSDVNVRRAVGYAIDNNYMAQVVWSGEAQVTHEVGSSSLIDYNPDWNDEENYYQYDKDKAMELLAEAGYADGLDLIIFTTTGTTQSNLAVVLQAQLKEVGINLEIKTMDTSIQNNYRASDRSSWDICIQQVGSEDFMANAYDKAYVQGQNAWEGTGGYWVDETMDEMLKEVTSLDGYSVEGVEEFHEYTIDLCLMYGIANGYSNYVLRNGIQPVLSPTGQDTYLQAFYWTK